MTFSHIYTKAREAYLVRGRSSSATGSGYPVGFTTIPTGLVAMEASISVLFQNLAHLTTAPRWLCSITLNELFWNLLYAGLAIWFGVYDGKSGEGVYLRRYIGQTGLTC
jgi:hypothetical protein